MELILENVAILFLLLFVLGKSASWAVRAAISLSQLAGLSELAIGFLVIATISVLPEATVSLFSAFQGVPALGLGTLLGTSVADLTFVLGIVALLSRRPLKVESVFIQKDHLYLGFLLLPLILGFTGYFSRLDGAVLVASGLFFYIYILRTQRRNPDLPLPAHNGRTLLKEGTMLAGSLVLLALSAYYTVEYAELAALRFGINAALVGILAVALGAALPELLFSVQAARHANSSLALGDILGTVITDANIVLGVIILIRPFSFNPRLIILTGVFMLLAGLFSFSLLRSERTLTKQEGVLLLVFYLLFVIVEFTLRDWTPLIPK